MEIRLIFAFFLSILPVSTVMAMGSPLPGREKPEEWIDKDRELKLFKQAYKDNRKLGNCVFEDAKIEANGDFDFTLVNPSNGNSQDYRLPNLSEYDPSTKFSVVKHTNDRQTVIQQTSKFFNPVANCHVDCQVREYTVREIFVLNNQKLAGYQEDITLIKASRTGGPRDYSSFINCGNL